MAKKTKPISKPVEVKEEVKEITEPVIEKPAVEVPEIVDAKVDGVIEMLNVRSTPEKKEGNILMQLRNGFKLQVVDPKKSTGEWYKIIVTDKEKKTDGYVMKKFIKII